MKKLIESNCTSTLFIYLLCLILTSKLCYAMRAWSYTLESLSTPHSVTQPFVIVEEINSNSTSKRDNCIVLRRFQNGTIA